ncbi:MAG: hypothetical protein HYY04_16540 [Chloroflexi bacterium]|nr:hypothetical protein [Chloroflexota bacterium]
MRRPRAAFADTSYWIATLSPGDELHAQAVAVSRRLGATRLVTSEMVLTEVLDGFADRGAGPRRAAAAAVQAVRGGTRVRVIPQTSELFDEALAQVDLPWRLRLIPPR